MVLKVCNGAKTKIMDALTPTVYWAGLTLRLFKNDYVPVDASTVANFIEADFSGYQAIGNLAWNLAVLNAQNKGEIGTAEQQFAHNGGATANTVYGYYLTDAGGNLVYAERSPTGGFLISTAGQTYKVTLRFTDTNE